MPQPCLPAGRLQAGVMREPSRQAPSWLNGTIRYNGSRAQTRPGLQLHAGGRYMREAVICSPLRTPIGRYGGKLRDVDAQTLAEVAVQRLLGDTQLDGSGVDDCIF